MWSEPSLRDNVQCGMRNRQCFFHGSALSRCDIWAKLTPLRGREIEFGNNR